MLTQVHSIRDNGFKASDMAAEKSSSGTVQRTSVTGILAMPVGMESLRTHKVRRMKASSLITCVTEKALPFIKIATGKTVNGLKTSRMELASRTGQTVRTSEATIWRVRKRASEYGNGQMVQSMKGTGMTIKSPALEFTSGLIIESTKESTFEAKWKVSATISIPMAPSTSASTSETRGKDSEYTKRPTQAPTQVRGCTANSTDLA